MVRFRPSHRNLARTFFWPVPLAYASTRPQFMSETNTPFLRIARRIADPEAMRAWRFVLAALVVIVGYLALSPTPPKTIDLGWDKLNHAFAFTALAFCGMLGYAGSRGTQSLACLALLGYGGLIEILQLFVPGRAAEWADLLSDGLGIACGAVLAIAVLRLLAPGKLH